MKRKWPQKASLMERDTVPSEQEDGGTPEQHHLQLVRSLLGWATVLSVMGVLAGSWVPFRFEDRSLDDVLSGFVASLRLDRIGRGDFVANVLVGVPLGFLLFGWLCVGSSRSRAVKTLAASATAFAVVGQGLLCEIGQGWIPHRIPSATDVLAQFLGGIVGITLWWLFGERIEKSFNKLLGGQNLVTRIEAAISIAAIAVLVWSILPLDLLVSPAAIARKWLGGGIEIVPFTRPNSEPLEWLYQWVISAVIAVPLGLWAGVALLPRILGTRPSLSSKILVAVGLGILPELLQVPIAGRVASATDALFASFGVFFGILLSERFLLKGLDSNEHSTHTRPLANPSNWFIAALAYWIALCLVAWYPFDFVTDRESLRTLLERTWESPFSDYKGANLRALFVFFRLGVMSAGLGALLGGGVCFVKAKSFRLLLGGLAIIAVVLASLILEAGQLLETSHVGAGSGLSVRILGGAIGFWLARTIIAGSQRNRP